MIAFRRGFERALEWVCMIQLTLLCIVVIVGVTWRAMGSALSWYDELASIQMAWLTYYGAALAAIKRAHIGFPGLVRSLSPARRRAALVVSEALVIGFFALLAWVGWQVFEILEGDRLVSMSNVPAQLAQSVIPFGAVLFIAAELARLPETWRDAGTVAAPMQSEAATPDALRKDALATE